MTGKWYFSNLSLNSVITVIFLILYIPSLGLLLLHRVLTDGAQGRLEEQRVLIQKLDESINRDNKITKVTRKVVVETSDRVEQEFYNKDGEFFAYDVSEKTPDNKIELKSRTYYDKYKTAIARDIYESKNISVSEGYKLSIVKRREYLNQNGEMLWCEYFDENGVPSLISQNVCEVRANTMLSPFPPLFYFYR